MACRSMARVALFVLAVVPLLIEALLDLRSARGAKGCARLVGHDAYFTVEMQVGSPSQKFDVVPDTGSSNVIVNSCVCLSATGCDAKNKCFTGHRSTSFFVSEQPAQVRITFGSGDITSVVSSDVVRVGGVEATMGDGLLLMVDKDLDFDTPFEGILGLGTPAETSIGQGFIERSSVKRFSVCISENDGVLRLGSPPSPNALGSIGKVHWGLALEGISLGNMSAVVPLCSPSSMTAPGQLTACGAIPDSGSSLLMAPKEHLAVLFSSICDNWPRCRAAASQQSGEKHEVFLEVLLKCEDWLAEGVEDLPQLHFTVSGAGGVKQTVSLSPTSYLYQTYQDEMQDVTKDLGSLLQYRAKESIGRQLKVCAPAFGTMDYNTQQNGPIWILGLPLFAEFQVQYDVHAKPPTISFSQEPCGTCEDDGAALIVSGRSNLTADASVRQRARLPREIHAPPRLPRIDTRLPL